MTDIVGKDRGLVLDAADDDAGSVFLVPVAVDRQTKLGNVDEDVEFAEVARHPAPALHIGNNVSPRDGGSAVDRNQRGWADDAIDVEIAAELKRHDG